MPHKIKATAYPDGLLVPPFPHICLGYLAELVNNNVSQLPIFLFCLHDIHIGDPLVVLVKGKGPRCCLDFGCNLLYGLRNPCNIFQITLQGFGRRPDKLCSDIAILTVLGRDFAPFRLIRLNEGLFWECL